MSIQLEPWGYVHRTWQLWFTVVRVTEAYAEYLYLSNSSWSFTYSVIKCFKYLRKLHVSLRQCCLPLVGFTSMSQMCGGVYIFIDKDDALLRVAVWNRLLIIKDCYTTNSVGLQWFLSLETHCRQEKHQHLPPQKVHTLASFTRSPVNVHLIYPNKLTEGRLRHILSIYIDIDTVLLH